MTTTLEKWGFRDGRKDKPILQSQGAIIASTFTGAFAGAAMGRPSLYSGIVTTALGCITKIPILTGLGMGMVVSGGYQLSGGVNGPGVAGVKERVKAFAEDFKQRLYLDKIIKPKDEFQIEGFGNVQVFKYPLQGSQSLDMSALDNIQHQLAQSAMQFQQSELRGTYDRADADEIIY